MEHRKQIGIVALLLLLLFTIFLWETGTNKKQRIVHEAQIYLSVEEAQRTIHNYNPSKRNYYKETYTYDKYRSYIPFVWKRDTLIRSGKSYFETEY